MFWKKSKLRNEVVFRCAVVVVAAAAKDERDSVLNPPTNGLKFLRFSQDR